MNEEPERKKDPRNNVDDAFDAFMGMEVSEWNGLLLSLAGGGCLRPEEQKGFERARQARKESLVIPDYSEEVAPQDPGVMKRLGALVVKMAQLELEEHDLEDRLKETQKELRTYRENLVPEVMAEMGLSTLTTAGGISVEMREEVRAAFPKDGEKQAQAFAWLKATGNDGLVKREITVQYGRDSVQWAEELTQKLEEWGVGDHATVHQEWNIHHQTLLAFLRGELKVGRNVPMDLFGAFVSKYARIKRSK